MRLGRILFISAGVFGVGYAWHSYVRNRDASERATRDAETERRAQMDQCIGAIYSEPRPLIEDIKVDLQGPGVEAATATTGRLVEIPLTPQAQRDVWKFARFLSEQGTTKQAPQVTMTILEKLVAPDCDWSDGFVPYQDDPRFRQVWEAVSDIVNIAELSNKYYPIQGTSGALVAPGWTYNRPAPAGDVRVGDYLEVMIDRESENVQDPGNFTEWAWVRVDKVGPDFFEGKVVNSAPPSEQPHPLTKSGSHGVTAGQKVLVPSRFIFNVVHGE